jgi:hypothetical protein
MSVVPFIIKLFNRKKTMTEMPDYTPETGTFGEYNPNATPTEDEIAKAISHPVLTHLNGRLEKLENELSLMTAQKDAVTREKEFINTQLINARDKYRKAEYALTDLLKEMIADEDITLENAQRIADIFDNVTLTKRITIRYDIVASVEVEVPFGADEDEVADNTYCDSVRFDSYESNHEVLEVDFDVTDWNVVS